NFLSLMGALNRISEIYGLPLVYSTHPRSLRRINERGFKLHPLIRELSPFGFFDYNRLQMSAYCVLSDSGTLSEESAILHFPAVLVRTSTERPEVLDRGTVVIGGITEGDIAQAVGLCRAMWENHELTAMIPDYQDVNVSAKVVKLIQSYTKIVDRSVWGKD
ncbi:MAG: UDP-N-acetylglucosamine 2-epimerase, partial [Clostridia bacterium]|nr:UDP-N-acetylglucosamine 2-epimerase [Clostridia bacterium]